MAKVRLPNPAQQAAAMKQARFTSMSRLSKAIQKEFTLQSLFKLGYRNKEDVSNLPPYVLTVGSQNVLTNSAEQVGIRNGIVLDGSAGNQNTYGVDSSYDFNTHSLVGIQNLRKWGTTLEVRHENPNTGIVSWVTLNYPTLPALIATNVLNFCSYWETVGTKLVCLFVNGSQTVFRWTGGMGSFLSATSSTITLQGTTALSKLNFDQSGLLLINGNAFSYQSAGLSTATTYSQTSTAATQTTDYGHWISQVFTTGASAVQVTTVTTTLKVLNTDTGGFLKGPLSINAGIYTNNAGVPGTFVTGAVAALPQTSVAVSGDYTLTFNFNTAVTPSTSYCLVLYVEFPTNFTGTYATFSFYTGSSGGVGTTTGTTSTLFTIPTNFAGVNGYLNAVITENDESTTIFSGVTPDPTGFVISAGDAVIQAPTVAATTITGNTLSQYDLIECLGNQVYYGSFINTTVYISKTNNYADCSFSTPRLPAEGASATLDAVPVGFVQQDESMLVSAGTDFWYQSKFTLSADLAKESFQFGRLKTTPNQGAQSQAFMSKMKNNVIFVSYEPIFNTLGTTKDFLNSPQTTNLSDPIKYDMDAYDFTGGSSYYFNYFLYFSVPSMGVVRLYNVQKKYWEAPQILPVGRFYQVGTQLYGHSYLTNESYALFVPGVYNDNDNPIHAVAAFPYVSGEGAQPNQQKFFNKIYTEGYIAGNTGLTLTINYEFGAFAGTYSANINGADKSIVFNKITDGSLGQDSLGSQPIGTILNLPNSNNTPKFRIINTFPPNNVYEYQIVYSSYEVDTNWSLLRFGPAIGPARDMPTSISQ